MPSQTGYSGPEGHVDTRYGVMEKKQHLTVGRELGLIGDAKRIQAEAELAWADCPKFVQRKRQVHSSAKQKMRPSKP